MFIVATEFLKHLENSTEERSAIVRKLDLLKVVIENHVEKLILENGDSLVTVRTETSIIDLMEKVSEIIGSCLRTRFVRTIADILENVLVQFVKKATKDCDTVWEFVKIILVLVWISP